MPTLVLPPYAVALVREVRERSGHPIALVDEPAFGYDCQLRLARRDADRHEVAVVPEYRGFAVHFIVSSARKVLRICDTPREQRVMPSYEAARRLPAPEEDELRRNFGDGFDDNDLHALSHLLFAGAVQQLTSVPVDLRVERELYAEFPENRPLQRAYLQRQVADLEPHFGPDIAGPAPKRSYAAVSAMNSALAEEAAALADVEIGPLARSSPHRAVGARLRRILLDEKAPGYLGDLRITDAWAEELGMRGWYRWVRLDD